MSTLEVDAIKDKTGTKTLAALTSSSVTLDSGVVFPSNHVIYFDSFQFTSTAAYSDPGTTWTDSSLTITVPSASVALCSKIVVMVSNGFRTDDATYAMSAWRIRRSAPSESIFARVDRVGDAHGTGNATYEHICLVGTDASLGSGDHTYKLQYGSDDAAYGGNIYYHGVTTDEINSILVWGIK